jgi:hypothetical protein
MEYNREGITGIVPQWVITFGYLFLSIFIRSQEDFKILNNSNAKKSIERQEKKLSFNTRSFLIGRDLDISSSLIKHF